MMEQLSLLNLEEERTLFPLRTNFQIVKLEGIDAKGRSDHFNNLKDLISINQDMYPEIEKWFVNKVIPGMLSAQRIGYVAYEGEKPIASCILKLGDRSKFCHLRIHEDFQDLDLGQVFFTQMTLAIRHIAKEIHFTLPENLWYNKKAFFESFGFSNAIVALHQYRHGITEFMCSAPLSTVWASAIEKLPRLMSKFSIGGFSLHNDLLISIKPKYVDKIFKGNKSVEIRRKFSHKWEGCRAAIYASDPVCALIGEVYINSVTCGHPDAIWNKFEAKLGCTREEFVKYTSSTNQIYAIEFSRPISYRSPLLLSQIGNLLGNHFLKPPQSFCRLNPDKTLSWAQAVSIASFLHGQSLSLI